MKFSVRLKNVVCVALNLLIQQEMESLNIGFIPFNHVAVKKKPVPFQGRK